MRLASWLQAVRHFLFPVQTVRARRRNVRMHGKSEALESRTLLSATYSLEMVRSDATEGAPFGSMGTAELIVHKTNVTQGEHGGTMGVNLVFPQTGNALASPDQGWQWNDYAIYSDIGPLSLSNNALVGLMVGVPFDASGIAHIYIVAHADTLAEGIENVPIRLCTMAESTGIDPQYDIYQDVLGSVSQLNMRIIDSATVVTVSATDDSAIEPGLARTGSSGEFTLVRTGGDLTQSLTVNLNFANSIATNGTDFVYIGSTVTFMPYCSTVSIPVIPLQDNVFDDGEQVGLAIDSGSGYSAGTPANAMIVIHDSPPDFVDTLVSVVALDDDAEEDDDQGSVTAQTFRITRPALVPCPG